MKHRPGHLLPGLQTCSGLYLWAAFIVLFGVWRPNLFLTSATLHSVAASRSISAMLALAVLVPLAAGVYDLSVGAVINLSAIMAIKLMTTHQLGMWPAITLTVLVCAAVGAVSGFIVVKLRVNSFVATLGMGSVVTAIQSITPGRANPPHPRTGRGAI
jgi:ribose transport system permease protein